MAVDWIPLVTTPLGAALGAGVTYGLSRSRLGVTIDRISISSSRYATSVPVLVDKLLQEAVIKFPVNIPEISGIAVPERTYVTYLEILRQTAGDLALEMTKASASARRLREAAAAEEFSKMIDLYRLEQEPIWGWAEGESRRGRTIFTKASPIDENETTSPPFHPVHEVEDAYIVAIPGPLQLLFSVNPNRAPHSKQIGLATARRAALAFAYHRREDLMDYFGSTRDALDDHQEQLHRIRDMAQKELDRLARLEIDFLVSNAGRSGVSIGSEARARILMKGYVHGGPGERGNALTGPVSVDLRVTSDSQVQQMMSAARSANSAELRSDEVSPIVVQAGQTVRLLGISEELMSDHPNSSAIRAAYSGAERLFHLELARFRRPRFFERGNRSALRIFRSRRVLFRDLRLRD